jgi:hypothetical protein
MLDYRHIVFPEPCEHPFLRRLRRRESFKDPHDATNWKGGDHELTMMQGRPDHAVDSRRLRSRVPGHDA